MKAYLRVLSCVALLIVSCAKSDDVERELKEQFPGFFKPGNFPDVAYRMSDNPISEQGFVLGRKLFYDVRLSRNATISCGSCHIQSSAFTHHGHDVSHGIEDRLGRRNSPPIMNLAWHRNFMWDGGIVDLDLQPLAPISAHEEMDEKVSNILAKLRSSTEYPAMFRAAFGTEEISTARMLKALSQFMLMAVSANSKYDKVMRQEGEVFTEAEAKGYALFKTKCSNCHTEPLFSDDSFRNNGIGASSVDDKGRYEITLDPADMYKFRVPSLRNLKYSPPYMHDGRFYTLSAVLQHYNDRVKDMDTLDPLLKGEESLGIALSEEDKENLLAFLNTLNDEEFIRNSLLSEQ